MDKHESKRLLDAATCIATEVLGTTCTAPVEGVSIVADHICVRRGNNLTILAEPYIWTTQALDTFGPVAFSIAAESGNGTHLARSLVRVTLSSKASVRPKLTEYRIPVRVGYRYSGNRMARLNLDTKAAVILDATYGAKGNRPGNGARGREKKALEHAAA